MAAQKIVIVGLGYVGSILSLCLAQQGISVVVIECGKRDLAKKEGDVRHFGLTRDTRELLEKLRLWPQLKEKTTSIERMTIRDQHEAEVLILGEVGDTIGQMLPAHHLQSVLRKAVLEHKVECHFDQGVETIERLQKGWLLTTKKAHTIKADLIVAADGFTSPTREMLGITTDTRQNTQNAWQFVIQHSKAHQKQAFEYLLPDGPYVVLPSSNDYVSKLIWCSPSDDQEALEQRIVEYFPADLGTVNDIHFTNKFPLELRKATSGSKAGAVLIGDAYQRVHPVGAQGLNLGIRDAKELANHLSQALRLGLDIHTKEFLANYDRKRYWDRQITRNLTDFLAIKAGNNPIPLNLLSPILKAKTSKRFIRRIFHGE